MESTTLLARLGKLYPQASKTTLRDMVQSKRVQVNGRMVKSMKEPLQAGDKVEVLDAEKGGDRTVLAEGLTLVHYDSDIIIVDKPAGLLTATDAQEKRPTVWRILIEWFRKQNHKNKVHLIHRLDRDASGLLVFARNWEAYGSLKQQFFEHTITRQYEVIVHGIPKPAKAKLENLLLENQQGIVHLTKDLKEGKLAILDFETLETSKTKQISRLRCSLFTGRKHQIRVQMKAAGHAVCGDPVYGVGDEPPGRLALHAARLTFVHPKTGKSASFESPAPGSFAHLFRSKMGT